MSRPRIVSLLSSATEMLYALGLAENVVAVSHECDWPPEVRDKPRATRSVINSNAPSREIDDEVKRRLAAGEPLYEVDADLIARLRPDLIVTQAQCDVCAVRLADVEDLLALRPELAMTRLLSLQPDRLGDIFRDIVRVAEATDRLDAGQRYVAELDERVQAVCERTEERMRALGRWLRVAIIEWTEPLMLAGNWTPELVEIAGGDCPLAIAGEHSRFHAWNEIAALDPEAIVVAPCGFDLERSIEESRSLARLPGWNETSAAKSGRIFAMDGNAYLNRSGPRIVDTLEIMYALFWDEIEAVPYNKAFARIG